MLGIRYSEFLDLHAYLHIVEKHVEDGGTTVDFLFSFAHDDMEASFRAMTKGKLLLTVPLLDLLKGQMEPILMKEQEIKNVKRKIKNKETRYAK